MSQIDSTFYGGLVWRWQVIIIIWVEFIDVIYIYSLTCSLFLFDHHHPTFSTWTWDIVTTIEFKRTKWKKNFHLSWSSEGKEKNLFNIFIFRQFSQFNNRHFLSENVFFFTITLFSLTLFYYYLIYEIFHLFPSKWRHYFSIEKKSLKDRREMKQSYIKKRKKVFQFSPSLNSI